ncbi:MAG TPA: glycoside hydrolase family 57 protein [Methylomirabilota bacterium]|jgi:alpha-amylase/alpha-mannosidase (GH57 family)|nr:glycoside hydrolase family 57 protein [Methylomirabilota bacterium]
MKIWHLTPETPRSPSHLNAGEQATVRIGTYPIEPAQTVWVDVQVYSADGKERHDRIAAHWRQNENRNSYWDAEIGPFADADRVRYRVHARHLTDEVQTPPAEFTVGPAIHLAVLWHMHQPLYRDLSRTEPKGAYPAPWVRLHALRDYYSMAALVSEFPAVHLTINLAPSLLWQIDDYVERGATDTALDLTLTPAEALSDEEQEVVLATFFAADWHHQIYPHARYRALFEQRVRGEAFSVQDLRDLQMWANLAWFGLEFRTTAVRLPDGEVASVQRFVEQGAGFTAADISAMVSEQYKILRNIVPLYRQLQDGGQIEISTTPFYHPILPLLVDTAQATLDKEGTALPERFAWPEDADAQVRLAVEDYTARFGRPPAGMWPAEGAVSQAVVSLFARHGIQWIASDQGVLARSGRWGYHAENPDVLCQAYRAEDEASGDAVSIFFRAADPSNAIGFQYSGATNEQVTAQEFVSRIKTRFAAHVQDPANRVLSVILDGENAWGAYRDDGRPFLRALYATLAADPTIRTVTFREYLEGNPARHVRPHPRADHPRVYDLFCGSWIDEAGSAPGVDLGTWIGEPEENRGWQVLQQTREFLAKTGVTPTSLPQAFAALYAAEGSDWFWWFGSDQDSGADAAFDDYFRTHLKSVYRALQQPYPAVLDRHIVPRTVVWSFTRPVRAISAGDSLTIRTNCPGQLRWWTDAEPAPQSAPLKPRGGVMAGQCAYSLTLGPFVSGVTAVRFTFSCGGTRCDRPALCCRGEEQRVVIL